jgi:hypothetical protein
MPTVCVGSKDVLTGVEDLEVPEGRVSSVLDVVTERGGDVRCRGKRRCRVSVKCKIRGRMLDVPISPAW